MRRFGVLTVLAVVATLLAGCGTSSEYAPRYFNNRIVEAIEGDRYMVKAWGHPDRPYEDVSLVALVEASELALEKGHSHFRVIEGQIAKRKTKVAHGLTLDIPTYVEIEVELGEPGLTGLIMKGELKDVLENNSRWYNAKTLRDLKGVLIE